MTSQNSEKEKYRGRIFSLAKNESDRMTNFFLAGFFSFGLMLAFFYNTWGIAIGIGGVSLSAYYSTRQVWPGSNFYQYVLAVVLGIFVAQYIYQMHGLFEMNFVALIGSAILVMYQNWKLQLPLIAVMVVHHAIFGYLHTLGFANIYFGQFEHLTLQAFIFRGAFGALIFFNCGFWAYRFKKYTERNIDQCYEIVRLGEEQLKKEELLAMSENIRISNERLQEAQKIAHIGSWTWDIKKNITFRTDEFYKIVEKDKFSCEPNFEGFLKCVHPGDLQLVIDKNAQAKIDHQPFSYEVRFLLPDGRIKYVFAMGKVSENSDGEATELHGIIQDITERKLSEQKINEAGRQLNNLFNTVDEILFSVDMTNFQIIQISTACEKIYGYSPAEFMANPKLWGELISSADMDLFVINDPLQNGKTVSYQFRVTSKDKTMRWVETKVIPTFDETGKLVRLDGVTTDITTNKAAEAEIIALNASLEEKVKNRTSELEAANKELESFSYSVSHDLRAPLRIINGFGKLLLRKYADKLDAEGKENLEIIMSNAKRMGHLIDDLLDFSRVGRTELQKNRLDMNGLVKAVIDDVKSMDNNMAEVRVHDLKSANADPSLIKQVWVNLLTNATKYSRNKEKPVIEIGTIGENGHLTYYVKDNGAGFDMEHYGKLFGVFQRLHKVTEYEGTGVGLALTQRIINRHGGKIWAESKIDEGATFYFTLPTKEETVNH